MFLILAEINKFLNQHNEIIQQKKQLAEMQEILHVSEIKTNQRYKRNKSRGEKFERRISNAYNRVEIDQSENTRLALYEESLKYFMLTRMTGVHLVPTTSTSAVKGGVVNIQNCSVRCFDYNLHDTSKEVVRDQLYNLMASQSSGNASTWKELFEEPDEPTLLMENVNNIE